MLILPISPGSNTCTDRKYVINITKQRIKEAQEKYYKLASRIVPSQFTAK